jgi:hypothetical protein
MRCIAVFVHYVLDPDSGVVIAASNNVDSYYANMLHWVLNLGSQYGGFEA